MAQHPASSSSSPKWCYDVFLSFRGDDTREGFASHLFTALKKVGINTFMDVKLEKGEEVASELSAKIEESRLSIVVFSENYASSRWCLNELEKIIEFKEKMGHQVIPVFFKVEPSNIRNLKGQTGEHLKKFRQDPKQVKRWEKALKCFANLNGWTFKEGTKTEPELIQDIVKDVSGRLNREISIIADYPVGIEDQIEKINPYLGFGKDEVRMIGICGVKGIGKSTIGRAIVNSHGKEFEGSSFLEDLKTAGGTSGIVKYQGTLLYDILRDDSIRLGDSHSGASVIKQRLRSKKVLVVIDGANDLNHLRLLAGGVEWFGPGSRIIITTRKENILNNHGVEHLYRMVGLDKLHATRLFCRYAFRKLKPPDMFAGLSEKIVNIAKGIPRLLIFIGSNMYGKSVKDWEAIIKELEEFKECEVTEIWDAAHKITIDGLDKPARTTFLVIAYALNGKDKEDVMKIINVSPWQFNAVMKDLADKSLIQIQQNKVSVSDSLRKQASEIVHAMSRIKIRLMRILKYLDDATDELDMTLTQLLGLYMMRFSKTKMVRKKRSRRMP